MPCVSWHGFGRRFRIRHRGIKPYGNLCAAPNFRSDCWRLILCKAAANQNGIEAKLQAHFRDLADSLAAKIGDRDVTALIERNRNVRQFRFFLYRRLWRWLLRGRIKIERIEI